MRSRLACGLARQLACVLFCVAGLSVAHVARAEVSTAIYRNLTSPPVFQFLDLNGSSTVNDNLRANGQAEVELLWNSRDPFVMEASSSDPGVVTAGSTFCGVGGQVSFCSAGLNVLSAGSAVVTTRAFDSSGTLVSTVAFTLNIEAVAPAAPQNVTATAGDGQALVAFSPPIFDGGAPITTYEVSSSPGGITATGTGSPIAVAGLSNGTPYTFTVTATNAVGTSAPSPESNVVTPPGLPVANDVSATLAYGSGETPIDLDIAGAAATAVTVATAPSHGTAVAIDTSIRYTPPVGFAGPDSFTYTATNAAGTSAPATVSITVDEPDILYTPPVPASATVGVAYSQSLAGASGGSAPYTYAVASGALPTGLSLGADGLLSGTPTQTGSFVISLSATDSSTGTGPFSATSDALTLTVEAPLITISPPTLADAVVSSAYTQSLAADGGAAPYAFSIAAGALPPGLTLSSEGTLSGIPSASGTYNLTITATDSSAGSDAPFSGSRAYAINVGQGSQTITFGAQPDQVFAPGGSFELNPVATASSGLPVSYSTQTPGVCTISGTLVTIVSSGTCTIAADQAGNGNFDAAAQVVQDIAIGSAAQAITAFIASPAAPVYAPEATFSVSATGGASGNPVVFASTTAAVCTVSGSTVTIRAAGDCSLTADQAGNADYEPAPQASLMVGVGQGSQTITFGAQPDQVFAPGGSFELNPVATASSGLPVSYSTQSPGVCTISGTLVTIVSSGTCTIAADQAGDGNFDAAAQVAQDIAIGGAAQAITAFIASPAAPVYAPDATFSVSATGGASGHPVVFASTTAGVCTIAGNTVTIRAAGDCSLTADQAGNANYEPAPQVTLAVAISTATPTLSWVDDVHKSVGEPAFHLPLPSSNSSGAFTFSSSDPGVATLDGRTVTVVGVGTATLVATQAATGDYTQGSVSTTLSVSARPDPTQDPAVVGGLQAQVDASMRLAAAQQGNIHDRLRQLRASDGTNASSNQLRVNLGRAGGQSLSLPTVGAGAAGPTLPNRWGMWAAGALTVGERDGSARSEGFEFRSDGVSVGIDRLVGDRAVVGLAGGYGGNDSDFADDRSRLEADQRSLAAYGLWRAGERFYVEGLLGWGRLGFDIARWSDVAGAPGSARRDGDQHFASLSVGYQYRIGTAGTLTGYSRLDTVRTTLDAYRETGLGIHDLVYREQDIDSRTLAVGVEGSHPGTWGALVLRPFWSFEYRDSLRNEGSAALNYVVQPVATDYTIGLRSHNADLFSLGAGVDVTLGHGWLVSLLYQREHSGDVESDTIGVRLVFGGGAAVR